MISCLRFWSWGMAGDTAEWSARQIPRRSLGMTPAYLVRDNDRRCGQSDLGRATSSIRPDMIFGTGPTRAERAGIVYIDVWDGFVDEAGKYPNYGPLM